MKRLLLTLCALCVFATPMLAKPFVPQEPVLDLEQVKVGERGYMKTEVDGGQLKTFPVEALEVVHSTSRPKKTLLIRALKGGLDAYGGFAEGMSGSPVYFRDKLVGAVGYTWAYGDHNLAQVTSIDDMVSIFNEGHQSKKEHLKVEEEVEEESQLQDLLPTARWTLSGVSQRGINALEKSTGLKVVAGRQAMANAKDRTVNQPLKPGESVAALIAWGDVDMSSYGTVTAVSDDGRFLAYGHSMEHYGKVNVAAAKAHVHLVVPSVEIPFKLASTGPLVGSVTHDRAEAIGGVFGTYPLANSFKITWRDEQGHDVVKRFQMAPDKVFFSSMGMSLLMGLIDDMQNRIGPGTVSYDLKFSGAGFAQGFEYQDLVASTEDATFEAVSAMYDMVWPLIDNPYQSLSPYGVELKLKTTPQVRQAKLTNLSVEEKEDTVVLSFQLLPTFGDRKALTHKVILPKPEGDMPYSIVVRGGNPEGIDPNEENGPETFADLLAQLKNMEHHNQVIVEIEGEDLVPDAQDLSASELRKAMSDLGYRRVFKIEAQPIGALRWMSVGYEEVDEDED